MALADRMTKDAHPHRSLERLFRHQYPTEEAEQHEDHDPMPGCSQLADAQPARRRDLLEEADEDGDVQDKTFEAIDEFSGSDKLVQQQGWNLTSGTPGPTAAQGRGRLVRDTRRRQGWHTHPPTHGIASSRDVRCSRALHEDGAHDPEQGQPCADGATLGQGERSPSNKPYLQRVTEWTRQGGAAPCEQLGSRCHPRRCGAGRGREQRRPRSRCRGADSGVELGAGALGAWRRRAG